MNTDFKTSYGQDVKKTSKALKARIKEAVKTVEEAKTMKDIPQLKKAKGCKKGISYRIRIGDYRIGVEIVGDMVTFTTFGHRNCFYNKFP